MVHLFPSSRFSSLNSEERKSLQDIEFFLKAVPFPKKKNTIYMDHCCGIGYFTIPVAEKIGDDGTVYAIDVQKGMLDELKKIITNQNLNNIKMIQGDIKNLSFKEKTVDIVNMGNGLHELKYPELSLKEIKRILKSDGKLILVDWEKTDTPFGPPLAEKISSKEAVRLLQKVGFQVVGKLDYSRFFYLLICDL